MHINTFILGTKHALYIYLLFILYLYSKFIIFFEFEPYVLNIDIIMFLISYQYLL